MARFTSFGDYWRSVLEELKSVHGWDDPVTGVGEYSSLVELIFIGYMAREVYPATARMVNQCNELGVMTGDCSAHGFGAYWHLTMEALRKNHGFDRPVSAVGERVDLIDLLWDSFGEGYDTNVAAYRIHAELEKETELEKEKLQ